MISPRHGAVKRFLRRAKVVHIATLSPAGNPDLIPLWFVTYRGRIYMATRPENPTVRDLLLNPEVALLFHPEEGERVGRVLRLRGRATYRREKRVIIPVYALSALRYYCSPGAIRNTIANRRLLATRTLYRRERVDGGEGLIEVTPETAEFVKLPS